MECTLRATVRYDGTDFAGWQRQADARTLSMFAPEIRIKALEQATPEFNAHFDVNIDALQEL